MRVVSYRREVRRAEVERVGWCAGSAPRRPGPWICCGSRAGGRGILYPMFGSERSADVVVDDVDDVAILVFWFQFVWYVVYDIFGYSSAESRRKVSSRSVR